MKLVYLGTPDMAVPPLRALVDAGHDVLLVVTGADKRRGRRGTASPSPVKAAATALGHDLADVHGAVDDGAELGVVVAFGKIIKRDILDALPVVNVHFSLLPRWRGAAPVERALLAGDTETGVCIMAVEEGLDTGGVYARETVPIGPRDTAADLRAALVEVGSRLLVETLDEPLAGWIDEAEPQQGEMTYAEKFSTDDFEIHWEAPVEEIDRLIRVGGAWTTFRGKRLKIHAAELTDGRLVPTQVQPEGKAPMDFDAWRNGARPAAGEPFGDL
jgi:methionyl-tRNA formyltransferase